MAERGAVTLEEVGSLLNLTRERVRQLEVGALAKLQELPPEAFEGVPEK